MYILIAIYCLLFAWLSYHKTKWAIFIIVATLPSYLIRFQLFSVPLTLLEIMILILFLIVLLKKQIKSIDPGASSGHLLPSANERKRNKLRGIDPFDVCDLEKCESFAFPLHSLSSTIEFNFKNIYTLPIVAILIFATISIFKSADIIGALGIWKAYFIEPILFLLVFVSIIKNRKELDNIFKALGISAIYLSLIAFWQYFSAWNVAEAFLNANGSVDRVTSIFSYPNALGLYLGPIVIIFTGLLFKPKNKIFKVLVIIMSLITIILAASEAALVAILTVWIIWGLIYKKTRIPIIILLIILGIFISVSPSTIKPISDKLLLKDYSGYIRRLIYLETWKMLKDNWFWGGGLNNYRTAIIPYHLPTFEYFMYPHNIIFNFWTELGLLGLLSFVWLTILFLWQNIKNWFKNKDVLYLMLIFTAIEIIIHGLVDVPYFKNDLAVLFWMIIGISMLINKPIYKLSS